jgi:hypothetical protein
MTETVNETRSRATRNRNHIEEQRRSEELPSKEQDQVSAATDRTPGADVQGAAHNITNGRAPDAYDGTGAAGAAGTGSVVEGVNGARIDRASARLPGPGPSAQPVEGAGRTVYHFTGEDQARGVLRNGPRGGDSGLAYFTSKDTPRKAGAAAQQAPFRLDVNVRGTPDANIPYEGKPGEVSWNGAYEEARNRPGVNDHRAADAVRNRTIQDHLNGRPEERFSIKVDPKSAQRFEVYKPDALAGSTVDKITPVDNGRSIAGTHAGDARTGRLVANEVLSGNADSTRRAAQAAGMSDDAARNLGRAATVSKYAGRVLVPVGIAADVYETAKSDDPTRTGVGKAAAWGGAWAGAKGGAALGATIGAFGGPVGAAVGGVIGAVGGGIAGYIGGEKVGQWGVDAVRSVRSWLGW